MPGLEGQAEGGGPVFSHYPVSSFRREKVHDMFSPPCPNSHPDLLCCFLGFIKYIHSELPVSRQDAVFALNTLSVIGGLCCESEGSRRCSWLCFAGRDTRAALEDVL